MACLRGIIVASSLLVLLMALTPLSHATRPSSPPSTPSGGNPHSPPPSDPSPPPPSDPSPPPPSHGNPHSPPPPSDPSPPPPSHSNPHSPPSPSDPSPPPPSPPSNPSPHPDGNPPSHSPAPEGPYPCEHDLSSSCRNHHIGCPLGCPTNCFYNCRTCTSNCRCHMIGGICQDPRFVGGDGVVFYFHGKRDSTFCLVSDSGLHINALFIGKEREGGLKRDFTWVKSLGIVFGSHKLYLGANKVAKWDDNVDQLSIAFDSTPIVLPLATRSSFEAPEVGLQIIRNKATNSISVEVQGLFAVEASVVPITAEESRVHKYGITDDDCFAHIELHFRFFHLSSKVQGVLGQTYAPGFITHVNRTSAMPIMGGERLYATSSLFATDCQVSQFGLPLENSYADKKDFPAVRCGMGDLSTGAGIVCRR